jgi:hypothetical protein
MRPSPATAFGNFDQANGVAIQADGKIVAAGSGLGTDVSSTNGPLTAIPGHVVAVAAAAGDWGLLAIRGQAHASFIEIGHALPLLGETFSHSRSPLRSPLQTR